MSRHFDTWKQCLPKTSEGRLTQMVGGNSFPLWNYRSGIITRALAKKVDIGQTNSLFAKLPAPTTQKETQLSNQTSNDAKKVEQLRYNFSDKFVKRDPVRDHTRPLVTRTRKLHLRNKVLSYIYQDAKVWWGCGGGSNQNSTPGASENKPKNAGSDAGMLYRQPDAQRVRHNESDQISLNSILPRQRTLNNHLPTLDTLTIPIVTRSISRLFETWQQSFPRSRQDLQTQTVGGALWYHQSGIIRTLTESSGIRTNPSTVDMPTASHPNHLQHDSLSDAKEKVIPQQMEGLSRVRVGIGRSDDRSMITRSRKLHLKNKVLSHIYQDAKNWWDRGDSSSIDNASKALESKQGSDSRENMPPRKFE